MEIHQVRYFLAVANTLNFTRAAELCHVSQPALTVAIKRLEEELGGPLLHREGRRILLTEFGRLMQPHLSQIFEQTGVVQSVAANYRLLKQVPIRLGVMSTIGPMRLARFLAGFEQGFPGVEVAVHEAALEVLTHRLDADGLDLAILNPLDGLGEGYRTEPLYKEQYVVLLPPNHSLKERNAVSLKALSGQPYVDRLACEMREMVTRLCGEMGVELYARFRSEREDWVQAMVMASIGFAFMPEYSVTHPDMLRRPLVDPVVERVICLVTVAGRKHSPAVAALMRAARSYRWPG